MAVLNLFDPGDLASIRARIAALQPSATRQWGTMTPPQMLAHTAISFESACRDDETQRFLGRIVGGFVRPLALNEKPFNKGAPTDPTFVVSDEQIGRAHV